METKPPVGVNFKHNYLNLFIENTKSSMKLIMDDPQALEQFGDAIINDALDLDGPRVMNRKPSPTNIFIANTLMKPFYEILDSYDRLTHIKDYIRIYPYKKYGISNLTYLRYHIENYLNNIYILRERLEAYLNKINGSSGFLVGDIYWLMSSNTLPYHGMDLSAGVKKLYRLGYYENQTDLYRAVQFSGISCPGPIEGNFW